MMEFEVKLNHNNMQRMVIIGKAAGLYLEVIDPQKERFNQEKEVGEKGIGFVVTLGEKWHNAPEGTLYVVERAPDHQTQPITHDDYVDAIMFYCKERNLNWGTADPLNDKTWHVHIPAEVNWGETVIPSPLSQVGQGEKGSNAA